MVYKLNIRSGVETVIYRFQGDSDGAFPSALIRDKAGNLYGTTTEGGNNQDCITTYSSGCGTLFEIDTAGVFSVRFTFNGTDGNMPNGVMEGPEGKVYGTTAIGGNGNCTQDGLVGCRSRVQSIRRRKRISSVQLPRSIGWWAPSCWSS